MKKLGVKNKTAVSAIVATVFMIAITIFAVGIIWGMVIPYIKGNLNFEQRNIDLYVVTGTGYTVYDKDQGMAFVQVGRGMDNFTLHGMEMMIDFDGTTYKTTLRAPNPGQSKSYFFDMKEMKSKNKMPGTISIAPIFILDAREVLGDITSQVQMPILNIVKNYTDIILDLQNENNTVAFVNITEKNTTTTNLCDSYVGEDPWGGCPIAMGSIYSVYYDIYEGTLFDFRGNVSNWDGKGIKFKGDNCIVKDNTCVIINAEANIGSWFGLEKNYVQISDGTVLNQTMPPQGWLECVGNNWFYVYDNANCK